MGMDDARHLLNRAGFGARPADLAEFAQLSRAAAIDRLLADTRADAGPQAPAELTDYLSPARQRALSDAVRGGLYGEPPNLARLDAGGNMGHDVDYRRLHAAVLERWWRLDSREVLGARFAPLGFVA